MLNNSLANWTSVCGMNTMVQTRSMYCNHLHPVEHQWNFSVLKVHLVISDMCIIYKVKYSSGP